VLYPELGLTKSDLAAYYRDVAEWILPYVQHRPLTLLRCPDGRAKECFFQKHATDTAAALRRVPLKESNGMGEKIYLAVDSLDGLLALVQMGVLELHVWGARVDRPEQPDQLVFDLDPDPAVPWDAVLQAAALTKLRLMDLGLAGFLRTTGGKGLHVVVPIARRLGWDAIKAFTKAFADAIVRENPSLYTTRLPLAQRKGKIFIDYLRNGRGATAISSYSTRARAGATVAVPLAWSELTPELRPPEYTALTVPRRLANLTRDPWQDFADARRAITRTMQRKLGSRD
jgi:bifunctional non-homologous end joining protein LigD